MHLLSALRKQNLRMLTTLIFFIFGDDSKVPLTEVLKAQEEPTLANEDDITPTDDHDYVLDDGGSLVSNADAEITFIECVNNTMVDVTPQGCSQ